MIFTSSLPLQLSSYLSTWSAIIPCLQFCPEHANKGCTVLPWMLAANTPRFIVSERFNVDVILTMSACYPSCSKRHPFWKKQKTRLPIGPRHNRTSPYWLACALQSYIITRDIEAGEAIMLDTSITCHLSCTTRYSTNLLRHKNWGLLIGWLIAGNLTARTASRKSHPMAVSPAQ